MQSYASPGRVITVANTGTDAVAVRADQPYRLGNLVGVTDGPAGVGDDLNLCVEGVFEQMVDLADGLEAAEAGTPVLMHVATFALVVGLADATDHVHFGVLAERMTRRRVVLVKLMPATAAAPASGGGDGGTGGGSSDRRMIVLTSARVGPSYSANADLAFVQSNYGYDGQDLRFQYLLSKTDGMTWPAERIPGSGPSKSFLEVADEGIYRITLAGQTRGTIDAGMGIAIRVESFTETGQSFSNVWLTKAGGDQGADPLNYQESVVHRFVRIESGGVQKQLRFQDEMYLKAGWKICIRILCYGANGAGGYFLFGPANFDPSDPGQLVAAFDAAPSLIVEKIS